MIASVNIATESPLSSRCTARRVPGPNNNRWQDLALQAVTERRWAVVAANGGTVANCYGYRAYTECVVAVASPLGEVVLWYGVVPANKATLGGCADACVYGARPIWDSRYTESHRAEARAQLIAQARVILGYGAESDDPTSARFALLDLDDGHRHVADDQSDIGDRFAAIELT